MLAMDICTKFHGNPSNSCLDISQKSQNVNLNVVLVEKPGDHETH